MRRLRGKFSCRFEIFLLTQKILESMSFFNSNPFVIIVALHNMSRVCTYNRVSFLGNVASIHRFLSSIFFSTNTVKATRVA